MTISLTNTQISQKLNRTINGYCNKIMAENGTAKKDDDMTFVNIYNPFLGESLRENISLNLKKPKEVVIEELSEFNDWVIKYDPEFKGHLFDKKEQKEIPTTILTLYRQRNPEEIAYEFMSEDLKKNYGYVSFTTPERKNTPSAALRKDYPQYGISGDRLIVTYLVNFDQDNIGGIGKLADKLEVKYCKDHNIEPNIISFAAPGSHIAHYKRGKKFIPPEPDTDSYEKLDNMFHCTDPNLIMQEMIEENKNKQDTLELPFIAMYLPKNLCEKYASEML